MYGLIVVAENIERVEREATRFTFGHGRQRLARGPAIGPQWNAALENTVWR